MPTSFFLRPIKRPGTAIQAEPLVCTVLDQPTALLHHTYKLLAPGDSLQIINRGEWKTEMQQRLFTATSIKADSLGQVDNKFPPFQQPHFGWCTDKPQ